MSVCISPRHQLLNLISLLPPVSPDRDAKSGVMTSIDRAAADFLVIQTDEVHANRLCNAMLRTTISTLSAESKSGTESSRIHELISSQQDDAVRAVPIALTRNHAFPFHDATLARMSE